jgi:hypothetical protein
MSDWDRIKDWDGETGAAPVQVIPRNEYPTWPAGAPFPLVLGVYNIANALLCMPDAGLERMHILRVERIHGVSVALHVKEVVAKYESRRPKRDDQPARPPRRRAAVGIFDPDGFNEAVASEYSAAGGQADD